MRLHEGFNCLIVYYIYFLHAFIYYKLNTRPKIRKLSLLYNIVSGDTPDDLSDLLSRTVNQANNYNLRNANNFTIPGCRLTLYQNSFIPATSSLE